MLKEFSCREVGMDCDFKVRGETEDEVLKNAEMHGKEEHGIKELTEDIKNKILSLIHKDEEKQPETKIA